MSIAIIRNLAGGSLNEYFDPNNPYTATFQYSASSVAWEVPQTGVYMFELSGASGGTANGYSGAGGTYIKSYHRLKKGDIYYITVGSAGAGKTRQWNGPTESFYLSGGYNGGGTGNYVSDNNYSYYAFGGGGGATHISKETGGLSATQDETNILAVAGGGAGGGQWTWINGPQGSIGGSAQPSSNGILGTGSNYINNDNNRKGAGGGGLRGGIPGYSGTSLAASYGSFVQEVTYGARSGNGVAIITRVA